MFFDVSDALRKRCLAVGFLLSMLVDGSSSSSHQQQHQQQQPKLDFYWSWSSGGISEGAFRPPGSLLLRLILRHFRREIRWCFAVLDVFRKRCLLMSDCWFQALEVDSYQDFRRGVPASGQLVFADALASFSARN